MVGDQVTEGVVDGGMVGQRVLLFEEQVVKPRCVTFSNSATLSKDK